MTEADMASHLAFIRESGSLSTATHEGVVFPSEDGARKYSDMHDTDPVQIGEGWLAKNRRTRRGLIPTNEGDVVVCRLHQLFRVWAVTPNGDAPPSEFWNRAEAEQDARRVATEKNGRLFWLQTNGEWAEIPTDVITTSASRRPK